MPRNTKKQKKRGGLFGRRSQSHQHSINPEAPRRATHTQRDDVVDYLSEDDEINNQRYGCISFATITDEMKEEMQQQIADQLRKPLEDVRQIVEEWCAREHPKRGVKVRGCYKTMDQSYRRAEEIRNYDANFHIFTCEVGKWLPFDPSAELVEDENYMEGQLNELLKGYKLNKQKTKMHYDQRKREMMERAISEGTPEGQQMLAESAKPIEAVKFEAEQAEQTIEQLQDRIKDLERTKKIALKTLEERREELEALPPAEDERIVCESTVETIDMDDAPSELSESQIETLERDGIRRGVEKMREIQDQSKRMETSEFAQELSKRNAAAPGQAFTKPERSNSQAKLDGKDKEVHGVFGDNLMIPSQIRETYPDNGPTPETKRNFGNPNTSDKGKEEAE